MNWVEVAITTAIGAIITTLIGLFLTRYIKKQFKQKDEFEEFQKQKQDEKNRTDMRHIVREELVPVREDIKGVADRVSRVEGNQEILKSGSISALKNDILDVYYKCNKKGYRNDYDYQTVHTSFESYKGLGGNSFIVDVVFRFDNLPTKEEWEKEQKQEKTPKRGRPKKQILLEDK